MSERKNEHTPGGRENLRAWRCSGMVEYPKKFFSSFSLLMHGNGKEDGCVVISTLCAR
jgi:hypothetical protein